jgi:predicted Zn-dependent protease
LTEKQEFFAGRSTAASLLKTYPLYYQDKELVEYVNLIGLFLATKSDRPEVYDGYHFVILESDDVNAFAAPAGFIFITTGAIKACEDEDELAGILAHEITHVVLRHPELEARKRMQATTAAKWIGILGAIGAHAAAVDDPSIDPKKVTESFEKLVGGLADLAVKGYGREQELDADRGGAELLARAGYDPHALHTYLDRLRPGQGKTKFLGWMSSSHPHPRTRCNTVQQTISTKGLSGRRDPRRTERFRRYTRLLKGE